MGESLTAGEAVEDARVEVVGAAEGVVLGEIVGAGVSLAAGDGDSLLAAGEATISVGSVGLDVIN